MAKEEGENGFSERKRLKRVALAKDIIVSDSRAKVEAASRLRPSNVVIKHHGNDILKKSQRKNRFLFSFPGLLAPLPAQGGKIGELKDLATKNPILYLHFPKVFIYFDIHSPFPIPNSQFYFFNFLQSASQLLLSGPIEVVWDYFISQQQISDVTIP